VIPAGDHRTICNLSGELRDPCWRSQNNTQFILRAPWSVLEITEQYAIYLESSVICAGDHRKTRNLSGMYLQTKWIRITYYLTLSVISIWWRSCDVTAIFQKLHAVRMLASMTPQCLERMPVRHSCTRQGLEGRWLVRWPLFKYTAHVGICVCVCVSILATVNEGRGWVTAISPPTKLLQKYRYWRVYLSRSIYHTHIRPFCSYQGSYWLVTPTQNISKSFWFSPEFCRLKFDLCRFPAVTAGQLQLPTHADTQRCVSMKPHVCACLFICTSSAPHPPQLLMPVHHRE
jgi:hypothetical protein